MTVALNFNLTLTEPTGWFLMEIFECENWLSWILVWIFFLKLWNLPSATWLRLPSTVGYQTIQNYGGHVNYLMVSYRSTCWLEIAGETQMRLEPLFSVTELLSITDEHREPLFSVTELIYSGQTWFFKTEWHSSVSLLDSDRNEVWYRISQWFKFHC